MPEAGSGQPKSTARILQCASSLESLYLSLDFSSSEEEEESSPYQNPSGEEEQDLETAKMEMGEALKRCIFLTNVDVYSSRSGRLNLALNEILLKSYGQITYSSPLQTLTIRKREAVLPPLILGNIRHIRLYGLSRQLEPETWQCVGKALLQAPVLKCLSVCVVVETNKNVHRLRKVNEVCAMMAQSSLLSVHVTLRMGEKSNEEYDNLLLAILSSTCIKRVQFMGACFSNSFKAFLDVVAFNSSINDLVFDINSPRETTRPLAYAWHQVFNVLGKMNSLRELTLINRWMPFSDSDFNSMLDLLQQNVFTENIDVTETSWARDGRSALIQQALQRNKDQLKYFFTLSAEKLDFEGARAGRIFLCGLQYAGKSRLKGTMMKSMGKRTLSKSLIQWVGDKVKTRRTKGVEVELLVNNARTTISVWDLAGQEIFRSIQNILFPRLNQALLLVFVFKPFDLKSASRSSKVFKSKVYVALDEELRSWLRFIMSNTQVRGTHLPRVLVLITHRDKLKEGELSTNVLDEVVKKVRRDYKGAVEFCVANAGGDKYFCQVNSKSEKEVKHITDLLLSEMETELRYKSAKVPTLCSDIVSSLLKRPPDVLACPLLSNEKNIPRLSSMS